MNEFGFKEYCLMYCLVVWMKGLFWVGSLLVIWWGVKLYFVKSGYKVFDIFLKIIFVLESMVSLRMRGYMGVRWNFGF